MFFAGSLAVAVLPPFPPALGGAGGCDVPDELMQVDDKLPHPVPLKMVADGGAYRLYSGRRWVSLKAE